MPNITETDPILKSVRNAARQYGFSTDEAIGQQILLLGDAFYGYRFTSREFTAVWSALDQNLKMFDLNGKCQGSVMICAPVEDLLEEETSLQIPTTFGSARRAA